jgi:predicted 2-oxoglutarate/Fe(II)-dependent dioxygenase YbiX
MEFKFEKLAPCIYLYKKVIPDDIDIPKLLEDVLVDGTGYRKWSLAKVGDNQITDHRRCVDFKVGKLDVWPINSKNKELAVIYNTVNDAIHSCKSHYEPLHEVYCTWQQVINFVRYGEGQYFKTHPDDGPNFTCTLSSVLYLNDDYEGGELRFEEFDLTVKPEKGDHFLFPSSYAYRHQAMPVTGGVKYSAVTMFAWDDKFQTENGKLRKKDY